jgi:hypothetical protein
VSLIVYYDTDLQGSIVTWGNKLHHTVRETFSTEENAKKRQRDLVLAWSNNDLVMNECVGLTKREYRSPDDAEWKEGAGGISRHLITARAEIKSMTIVAQKGASAFVLAGEVYRLLNTWEERDNWHHAVFHGGVFVTSRAFVLKLARDFGFVVEEEK